MKNDFLYVLESVKKITEENPCKKKMQKLIYLIENSNAKLGYDYCIHYYGPYSVQLNDEIHSLYYEDKVEVEYKGMSHCLISKNKDSELKKSNKNYIIDEILQKYSNFSPNELERLTTTLYVMQNINSKIDKDIIQKVIDIKGSKYSKNEIQNDIHMIRNEKLFELK